MMLKVFGRSPVDGEDSHRTYLGNFEILNGGVLRIDPDEGVPILFSPAAWVSMEIVEPDDSVYEKPRGSYAF